MNTINCGHLTACRNMYASGLRDYHPDSLGVLQLHCFSRLQAFYLHLFRSMNSLEKKSSH